MSDERFGGSGPRKPRPTFGDVMLGIPAGRGGEREERPKKGRARGASTPRPSQPPATSTAPAQGAAPAEEAAPTPVAKPRRPERRRPQGPLVVVRRATGVVETRELTERPEASATPGDAAAAPVAAEPGPAAEAVPPIRPQTRQVEEPQPDDGSFADMLAASEKHEAPVRRVRVGEKVTGTIFQLGADTAFVSLGGRSEAMIELRELKDEEGILRLGVGDTVEAYVLESGARGTLLTRTLSKGSASLAMLAEARTSGLPVEGLVLAVNKGGFEVAVGEARAFVPMSQMDLRFVDKPEQFIGERLKFRVTELRERKVVLSRRSLLEEEQKALAAQTRASLDVGKVLRGRVTAVREFGAFVDLGGIEGLVPVGEMSHTRVGRPSDVCKVGDEVEVEVLRIEPAQLNSPDKTKHKERITLSMRARQEDPWEAAASAIHDGDRLSGKVVRLQPFGAFVELRPGVDGLIHISALSDRRIAHPRDAVSIGDEVLVQVEKIDTAEKRVGLRLVRDGEVVGAGTPSPAASPDVAEKPVAARAAPAPRPKVGEVVTGQVDRIEPYGVFLVFPGGRGLIPASETGTERGTDLRRQYSLGQELKVAILDVDAAGKIRLSIPAAQRMEERAEMEAWKRKQPAGSGGKGFGTLGDLLKGRKL
ncbi:MAG: S1 RNA-binding domain-containing protein [Myxococcaceae bacterium]